MTIATACPTCDEPVLYGYEGEGPHGWGPLKCEKCGNVMWIEHTSVFGTTFDSEAFFADICRPQDQARMRAVEAEVMAGEIE